MGIILPFEMLLWVIAVAVLALGFMFRRSRLARGRWMAAGIAAWGPGQILSTVAEHHRLTYAEQAAVFDIESACDLAYVLCTAIFMIQIARPKAKDRRRRTNRITL
ncbi:MAG: hypothetical protein ACTHJW_24205 [Streptosporangiaceae bacterium]